MNETNTGSTQIPPTQTASINTGAAASAVPNEELKDGLGAYLLRNGLNVAEYASIGFPVGKPYKLINKNMEGEEKLYKRSGYYIVPYEGKFLYIKIATPKKRGDHLYTFTPPPRVRREGFVVVEKKLIYVTLEDLGRGLIRLSREIKVKHNNVKYADFVNNTYGPAVKPAKPPVTSALSGNSGGKSPVSAVENQQQAGSGAELDECAAIDLVCKEQEQALLAALFEEEGVEYEIAETA